MVRVLVIFLVAFVIISCREDQPEISQSTKFIVGAAVQKAEAAEEKLQSAAVDP